MSNRAAITLATVGAIAMVASMVLTGWVPQTPAWGLCCGTLLFGGFCLTFGGIIASD